MLELKELTVGYSNRVVLRNVALSFDPGKIFTIVGKNGCGKSTLLKSCAGLLQPKDGAILLDGKELSGYSDRERAQKLSYLSQSRNTPNITVERLMAHSRFPHLGYPKKLREEDRAIISQSIRLLQLEEFRDKSLITLSGGERQRVYLAMQIAQDAPFLLLDEPTTYLDIEYQLMLMDLLAELKQQGKTIVMVLHDLEQALRYSDRIIAIDDKKDIHTGTPGEILDSGTLGQIFHVDIRRSEYTFERKMPHCETQ